MALYSCCPIYRPHPLRHGDPGPRRWLPVLLGFECSMERSMGCPIECSMECSMERSMGCPMECSIECSMERSMEGSMGCSIECSMGCSMECLMGCPIECPIECSMERSMERSMGCLIECPMEFRPAPVAACTARLRRSAHHCAALRARHERLRAARRACRLPDDHPRPRHAQDRGTHL